MSEASFPPGYKMGRAKWPGKGPNEDLCPKNKPHFGHNWGRSYGFSRYFWCPGWHWVAINRGPRTGQVEKRTWEEAEHDVPITEEA